MNEFKYTLSGRSGGYPDDELIQIKTKKVVALQTKNLPSKIEL